MDLVARLLWLHHRLMMKIQVGVRQTLILLLQLQRKRQKVRLMPSYRDLDHDLDRDLALCLPTLTANPEGKPQ